MKKGILAFVVSVFVLSFVSCGKETSKLCNNGSKEVKAGEAKETVVNKTEELAKLTNELDALKQKYPKGIKEEGVDKSRYAELEAKIAELKK